MNENKPTDVNNSSHIISKAKSNPQITNEFLQELLESCNNEGIIILRTSPPGMDNDLNGAFEYQGDIELRDDLQIFYTVNPRKVFTGYGQGDKHDVKFLIGLYVDIDHGETGHKKESFYETREEALKAVKEFPLKPTWLIDSGHGLQALYLFNEALVHDEDISLEEYEALNRGLQVALGADTTADATRLLRLPGSLNLKQDPKNVEVIEHNTDFRYSVDDFLEYITPIEASSTAENLDRPLNKVNYDKRQLPKRAQKIVKDLTDPKYPAKNDRSALVHTAVYLLQAKGFTPDQIFSALTEEGTAVWEYLKSIKKSDKGIKEYLNRSISKAEGDSQRNKVVAAKKRELAQNTVELLGSDVTSTLYFWKNGAIYPVPLKKFTIDQYQLLSGIRFSPEEFEKVKVDIISQASKKSHIDMNDKMLEGVWLINGKFLIISQNSVLLADPEEGVNPLDVPIYNQQVIDFASSTNWLDTEHFNRVFGKLSLGNVYDQLLALTSQFNWKHSEAADYAAALIMLSPLQQAMRWRPWVYLLGASNTGKTTFMQDLFAKLFPGLLHLMGKTTSHSIAQEVGNSNRLLLLDEFERYNKMGQIKELAKDTNRGYGTKTSGTPGPNAYRYKLYQMFWFASIVSSLVGESEENRTIFLELARHDGKHPPCFPDTEEMKRLGTEIVAVMIQYWDSIEERSKGIPGRCRSETTKKDRSRMHDSLSYPMALLELVEEEGRDGPFYKTPPEFVYRPVEKEEDSILEDILNSTIWVHQYDTNRSKDHKEQVRVFDAVYGNMKQDLHNVGMTITTVQSKEYLALQCKSVKRYLLKDSREYDYLDISEPLKRIPGALANHAVKIGGKAQRCVLIPLEYIMRDDEMDDTVAS